MQIKTKFNPRDNVHYISLEGYPSQGEIKSIKIDNITMHNIKSPGIYYEFIGKKVAISENNVFETPQEVYAELEERRIRNK